MLRTDRGEAEDLEAGEVDLCAGAGCRVDRRADRPEEAEALGAGADRCAGADDRAREVVLEDEGRACRAGAALGVVALT